MTPTPDGVGFLVSRIVLVAVPRLSVLCLEVSLNVHAGKLLYYTAIFDCFGRETA